MSEGLRFVRVIGTAVVVTGLLGWVAGSWAYDFRVTKGVWYGSALSLFNVTWGFFSIRWAFRRSSRTFFSVLLGGMLLRFILVGVALYLAWARIDLHFMSFVIALVGSYLLLQVLEIRFIQEQLAQKSSEAS